MDGYLPLSLQSYRVLKRLTNYHLFIVVPQFRQLDIDINLRKEKAFYQIVVKYVNPGTQEAAIGHGGFYPIGIGGP
jgi:hypothetical protein